MTSRALAAEALAEKQWEAGHREGVERQKALHVSRARKKEDGARREAEEAYERGRAQAAAEGAAALQREQAHRRLLLHRAEEARVAQAALERKLAAEVARATAAEGETRKLDERLRATRSGMRKLEGELGTERAARAEELQHFREMEEALGVACNEYSALATAAAVSAARGGVGAAGRGMAPAPAGFHGHGGFMSAPMRAAAAAVAASPERHPPNDEEEMPPQPAAAALPGASPESEERPRCQAPQRVLTPVE